MASSISFRQVPMANPWHFFVHHLPTRQDVLGTVRAQLEQRTVEGWQLRTGCLQTPFSQTFDEIRDRLDATAGGYCEGDGAFGWHPGDDPATHLCGTIHCLDERIMCFELHANVSRQGWERLKEILKLPSALVIQFPEWGLFVSDSAFSELLP